MYLVYKYLDSIQHCVQLFGYRTKCTSIWIAYVMYYVSNTCIVYRYSDSVPVLVFGLINHVFTPSCIWIVLHNCGCRIILHQLTYCTDVKSVKASLHAFYRLNAIEQFCIGNYAITRMYCEQIRGFFTHELVIWFGELSAVIIVALYTILKSALCSK